MPRKLHTATHHMQDTAGNLILVEEYQNIIEKSTLSDGVIRVKGMKTLYLSDGSAVNFQDENTFEVVLTGEILRRM